MFGGYSTAREIYPPGCGSRRQRHDTYAFPAARHNVVTRDHFDLHMERIDQRFGQTDQSIVGLDQRIGRLERGQSAHTVLLSIITFAVVIPLVQSTVAG